MSGDSPECCSSASTRGRRSDGRRPPEAVLRGRIRVSSAELGTGWEVNPNAVAALEELGIDMADEFPKPLTDDGVRAADVSDHDGLRRRPARYTPARGTRTGSSTTRPGRTSRRCAGSRRDRRARAGTRRQAPKETPPIATLRGQPLLPPLTLVVSTQSVERREVTAYGRQRSSLGTAVRRPGGHVGGDVGGPGGLGDAGLRARARHERDRFGQSRARLRMRRRSLRADGPRIVVQAGRDRCVEGADRDRRGARPEGDFESATSRRCRGRTVRSMS